MADDATTLNYVDDATTVTVSDDSTVVESAAAGAPGVGVPSGGTTGQALVKNSNADYDTHWSTPSTVAALDDLTDVTAPTPANGDGLVWNGTAWVNVDVATQAELNAHTGATGTAVHGLGTASTHNVPASGNAAAGEVVKGDDTRLTDNRTDPTKVPLAGGTMTGTLTGSADGTTDGYYWRGLVAADSADLGVTNGATGAFAQFQGGDGDAILAVSDGSGQTTLAGTSLTFNVDTNLYRDSANVLRTDDEFRAALIDGGTP